MNKAKHGHGSSQNLMAAIEAGKINEFDVLFLDADTDNPKMGWVDANGKPIILEANKNEIINVDALPESGEAGKIYILGEDAYVWTGSQFANLCKPTDVSALEDAIETKADAEEVEALEERVNAEFKKNATQMYEIAKAPEGTLVDYFDKEIRIMIPETTDFANLDNGIAGAENMRYVECRVYAPEGAVKYRFNFAGTIGEGNVEDFANCTDEHGRVCIVTAAPIAYYDTSTAAWVYYGANSTTKHYVGWNHTAEWFDENGVVIASDSVKINLSNEDCHYAVEPYYVGEMMSEIDTKIEEKIAEVEGAIEIVEF